jgi:uncharacterized phage protein (TIGR01671 family)
MREVKFRAWNKKAQDMGDWKVLQDFPVHLSWLHWGFKGDENIILMQYTGLKDKNGREIYEGDVVTCRMSYECKSLPHMGEIVYMEQFGAFATKNLSGSTLLHNHMLNTFEVIGNIYENPELVEEG